MWNNNNNNQSYLAEGKSANFAISMPCFGDDNNSAYYVYNNQASSTLAGELNDANNIELRQQNHYVVHHHHTAYNKECDFEYESSSSHIQQLSNEQELAIGQQNNFNINYNTYLIESNHNNNTNNSNNQTELSFQAAQVPLDDTAPSIKENNFSINSSYLAYYPAVAGTTSEFSLSPESTTPSSCSSINLEQKSAAHFSAHQSGDWLTEENVYANYPIEYSNERAATVVKANFTNTTTSKQSYFLNQYCSIKNTDKQQQQQHQSNLELNTTINLNACFTPDINMQTFPSELILSHKEFKSSQVGKSKKPSISKCIFIVLFCFH